MEPHKDTILAAVEATKSAATVASGGAADEKKTMSADDEKAATLSRASMESTTSLATRVLLADKLAPQVLEWLEGNADSDCRKDMWTDALFSVTLDPSLKDDSLLAAIKEVDPKILVVRSTKVTKEHLEAARSLSLIIRAGSGYNTIDVSSLLLSHLKSEKYVGNFPYNFRCQKQAAVAFSWPTVRARTHAPSPSWLWAT